MSTNQFKRLLDKYRHEDKIVEGDQAAFELSKDLLSKHAQKARQIKLTDTRVEELLEALLPGIEVTKGKRAATRGSLSVLFGTNDYRVLLSSGGGPDGAVGKIFLHYW
jgi:hypothetical protein